MCGIVAYAGIRLDKDPLEVVMNGLKRLEYRGYDSAGISFFTGHTVLRTIKSPGRLKALEEKLRAASIIDFSSHRIATGHTRWATHGEPSIENAHPHNDCTGRISVVHNGIIENHRQLQEWLKLEGHIFTSSTDTEILPHLIEHSLNHEKKTLEKAIQDILRQVTGSYAIAVMYRDEPDKIVVARHGSPLLIGLGEDEFFAASDASAILNHTRDVIYLEDGEMAVFDAARGSYKIISIEKGESITKKTHQIGWSVEQAQKGGYPHFMLKEICEAPTVIENAMGGRILKNENIVDIKEFQQITPKLEKIKRIYITACGTSYYASLLGKYLFEAFTKIPTEIYYASEFRYLPPPLDEETLVIVLSQSGETADTLEALREAKRSRALTIALANVVGSTLTREADVTTFIQAGPEIAVASTKAFIAQLVTLVITAIAFGKIKMRISSMLEERMVAKLKNLPGQALSVLNRKDEIWQIAKKYSIYKNFLYLGRTYNWPVAIEGALKLKEIAYIHAEGYPAGEMKHGPLALIDEEFPTMAIATQDRMYEKIISNIQELKARRGPVIAVASEENDEIAYLADDVIRIPNVEPILSPIITTIPLQLFAYCVAVAKKTDVDNPRNLAKSVTVE
jgi:glutamine---fructose-6-phosphate transaminase (isomerizing)